MSLNTTVHVEATNGKPPRGRAGSSADRAIAREWIALAEPLADWAWARLVNRQDVYGAYFQKDGAYRQFTERGLSLEDVLKHFRGERVIGVHTTTPDNRCRWVAVDIDAHGNDGADPDRNEKYAIHLACELSDLGIEAVVLESNGQGGYHVRGLFKSPIASAVAHWYLQRLVADHAEFGLEKAPEVFPKQAGVTIDQPYGNWLRLPGRHHKREFWPRVKHFASMGGACEWAEGKQAARTLLRMAGSDPSPILAAYAEEAAARAEVESDPWLTPTTGARSSRAYQGEKAPAEWVEAALAHLPASMADDHDAWLHVGMALHDWDPTAGYGLWLQFSKLCPAKFDETECSRRWTSFTGGGGLTIGLVFKRAIEAGWPRPWDRVNVEGGGGAASFKTHPHPTGENGENGQKGVFAGFAGSSPGESPKFEGDPQPLEVELAEVPELVPEMLPEVFREWLLDHAERTCLPIDFAATSALVAAGAVAARRLAIRPKRLDDWLAPPNIWGAGVGLPGILKTEGVSEGQRPLRRVQAEAAEVFADEKKAFEARRLVAQAQAKAAKENLEKAARKAGTLDSELEELARLANREADEDAPREPRYIAEDGTAPKVAEIMAANPSLLLNRDELSAWFATLDSQGREGERGFYLECWNGLAPYHVDRIGRGSFVVPRACISIFGTIQPGVLAQYIRRAAAGGAGNDGLLQRFQLLVQPDVPKRFVNHDRAPNRRARDRAHSFFARLDRLDPNTAGLAFDEAKNLHYLGFDDEAQEFFDGWRCDLENRLRSGELVGLMQAHMGKFRSLMPKLALIFHLADCDLGGKLPPVSLYAAEMAAAWCDYLEQHARRVYSAAHDGNIEAAERLGSRLAKIGKNPFFYRDVAKKGWQGLDTSDDVRRACGILEDRGWVKVVETAPKNGPGRPSELVWIHPSLLTKTSGTGGAA